jgi:hypothetical protein
MRSDTIGAYLPSRFRVGGYDRLNQRIAASMTRVIRLGRNGPQPSMGSAIGWSPPLAPTHGCRVPSPRPIARATNSVSSRSSPPPASAVECYAYVTCCVGAMVDAAAFPIATEADRRKVGIKSVSVMFRSRFGLTEPLHLFLERLVFEPDWRELVDWRDIAIHRGAVPQAHFLGTTGPPTPSHWNVSIHRGAAAPLVPALTADKLEWLIERLNEGVATLHDFLDRQGVACAP